MNAQNILIIGAGAAGLIAARELAKNGKKVTIFEARNRIGGRIHTMHENSFPIPVEAGAEFVHGDLPITSHLIKEASITSWQMAGKIWQVKQEMLEQADTFIEGWPVLLSKLKELDQDMSMENFLSRYFNEEKYSSLKDTVKRYLEGYDAADIARASAFALREEWIAEKDATQYRLQGGYGKLMDFLEQEIKALGCAIYLGAVVKEIHWCPGQVEVITDQQQVYIGNKVLITVPLGVLCSEQESIGYIHFYPAISHKLSAFKSMGFGAVIKFLLAFKEAFWEESACKLLKSRCMPELGFLFSEEDIPTWWTQLPEKAPVLTGWLAGPKAEAYKATSDDILLDKALDSLAALFNLSKAIIQDQLQAAVVINWAADPFARGAYAYATVETNQVRNIVSQPEMDTLFFAGEAFYDGPWIGTVEAALESGSTVAKQML